MIQLYLLRTGNDMTKRRERRRSMPKAELNTEWSYSSKLLNMQQHQNTPGRPGRTKCLQFLLLCSLWQKDCKFRTILGNMMRCSLKLKRGHGWSSVVGYLRNMCKMVESISVTAKEKKILGNSSKTSYTNPIGNSRGNELIKRVTGTLFLWLGT